MNLEEKENMAEVGAQTANVQEANVQEANVQTALSLIHIWCTETLWMKNVRR